MNLILLSDLHIKYGDTPNDILWLDHFCEWLRCNGRGKTVICVMGDIIHYGDSAAFEAADAVFDYLKNQLSSVNYSIMFLPGNHDYCDGSLSQFDKFCEKHQSKECCHFKFETQETHSVVIDGVNFIFIDSINNKDYTLPGKLNTDEITQHTKPGKTNILLLHHSLVFEDSSSHSGVVDQGNVLNILQKLGIKYVFHGHTHATRTFSLNNGILLLGTGSIGVEQKDLADLVNEQEQFMSVCFHESKLESIQNWQYRGGAERYIVYQLFPETNTLFDDPLRFPACKYNDVANYIDRTVISREKLNTNPIIRAFDKDIGLPLSDVVMKEKLVLLIADAGLGKSTELQHLAHTVSNKNPYFRPVLVNLNCYDGEDLQTYIQTYDITYGQIDPSQFLLILDGYDEIGNLTTFKKKLRQHLIQYPKLHICISMRSNFLVSTTDVFEDFAIYQLMELDQEAVVRYLEQNGVETDLFFVECQRKDLLRIVTNPFYLEHLIECFSSSQILPVRKDLMASITERCLKKDCKKFDYALDISLEDKIYELNVALVRMGYLLQMLRNTYCTDEQYQALLSPSDRNILRYSSYTVKQFNRRMFSHNIFREYFVAKYLSEKSVDEITHAITIDGTDFFDQNWLQVLGFVLQLKNDPSLIDWVFLHEPLALTKLEAGTVSDALRQNVLEQAIALVDNNNVWFRTGTCSVEELAVFTQSEAALEFLLDRIENPIHFRSQYFALSLLQHYTDLWGRDSEVKRALVSCYQSNNVRDHEKQIAIQALAKLGLASNEITNDLVYRFTKESSGYTRIGVYRYLKTAGVVNENIEYVLHGLKYISMSYYSEEHGIDRWALQECLDEIETPIAISRVIGWCSDSDHMHVDGIADENLFEKYIEHAAVLYKQGNQFLFEDVYRLFLSASLNFCWNYIDAAIRFFKETSTLVQVLEKLALSENDNDWFALDQLLTKEFSLFAQFCELYKQNKFAMQEWFEHFAWRNRYNDAIYIPCRDLVFEKTGKMMEAPKPRSHSSQNWQEDKQYFFDALFDKSKMLAIITDLLDACGNPNLKICELNKFFAFNTDYPLGTRELKFALIHSNLPEEKVSDFLDVVCWDRFVLDRLIYFFRNNRGKNRLLISDDQKDYIRTLYDHLLQSEDFHTSVKEHDNRLSWSWNLYYYWTFKEFFNFPITDDVAIGLLEIPYILLNFKKPEEKYSEIEKQINKDVIRERVRSLLPNERRPSVLCDLIVGCIKYRIAEGKVPAIKLCLNQDRSTSIRECAVDYLIEIFGLDYFLDEIAPQIDHTVFGYVLDKSKDIPNKCLDNLLKTKYSATNDYKLLSHMIYRNLPEGLESYYHIVKELKKSENQGIDDYDIVRCISNTSDPQLVPALIGLVKLRYSNDFEDISFHSLSGSLKSALLKCAEKDYDYVWQTLLHLKMEEVDNMECLGFCSQVQLDLMQEHKERLIDIKPLSEISTILRNIV